jgi:hypothetical protein
MAAHAASGAMQSPQISETQPLRQIDGVSGTWAAAAAAGAAEVNPRAAVGRLPRSPTEGDPGSSSDVPVSPLAPALSSLPPWKCGGGGEGGAGEASSPASSAASTGALAAAPPAAACPAPSPLRGALRCTVSDRGGRDAAEEAGGGGSTSCGGEGATGPQRLQSMRLPPVCRQGRDGDAGCGPAASRAAALHNPAPQAPTPPELGPVLSFSPDPAAASPTEHNAPRHHGSSDPAPARGGGGKGWHSVPALAVAGPKTDTTAATAATSAVASASAAAAAAVAVAFADRSSLRFVSCDTQSDGASGGHSRGPSKEDALATYQQLSLFAGEEVSGRL